MLKSTSQLSCSSQNTACHPRLSETGLRQDIPATYNSMEKLGSVSTSSLMSPNTLETLSNLNPKLESSMHVSAHQSKRKIWDVSGTISSQPTQSTTGSSQTRGRVFTATTNGIKPFWNSSTKEWSEKLLSCTATDLRELDKSSWTGSLKSLASGSWFTVKVKTTKKENRMNSCQSSPSSLLQAIMEKEQQRTNVDALKKQKNETKAKEKELKRIQDHNERVTKGWNSRGYYQARFT